MSASHGSQSQCTMHAWQRAATIVTVAQFERMAFTSFAALASDHERVPAGYLLPMRFAMSTMNGEVVLTNDLPPTEEKT